jgi:hypothetical protein
MLAMTIPEAVIQEILLLELNAKDLMGKER